MSPQRVQVDRTEGEHITLLLGCSPDKQEVFEQLSQRFNSFQFRLDQRHQVFVEIVSKDNDELVESALRGDFQVICPRGAGTIRSSWIIRAQEDFPLLTSCCVL